MALVTRASAKTACVVGDPKFGGDGIPQLPGALAEASEVRTMAEAAGFACTLAEREAATKDAVAGAACRASLVHLATHGCPDGLFLAGDADPTKPSLSTADVYSLELSAELAMLSACDTFGGAI